MERSENNAPSESAELILPRINPNPNTNNNPNSSSSLSSQSQQRGPQWPTIDGPLGLSEEASMGYARRFFKFGFFIMPFLWALNCLYFWPVLRHSRSFPQFRHYLKVETVIPFPIRFMSSVTSGSNNGSSLWVGKNNEQLVVSDETTRVEQIKLLDASEDAYGGVMVDMKDPMDSESFAYLLRASISQWRLQGKKGVWIKLPIELVNLVEAAVQEGFRYHHAEPSYLMLVKWISKTEDTLPANASHRIGIGAFVMNDMGEVLVVQEKNGKFKGTGVWKFPTGVVDQGEDICMAAVREVKEEAGIETEFLEILAFRQSHKSFFGKSDLFFVCMLRPLSFDIQKQDSEIEAAKWMPIEEYAAQPFNQKREQFSKIANICLEKKKNNYTGFSAAPSTTAFSSKKHYLYFNNNGNNNLKQ